jgi:S1-C subfamily serine protease
MDVREPDDENGTTESPITTDPPAGAGPTIDQQTASYAPPPEPHSSWAPADWGPQSPTHWFEPIAEPQPVRPSNGRGARYFAGLFTVALVAAILGSVLTFAALMATNRIGTPVANVTEPTPTTASNGTIPDASALIPTAPPLPVANSEVIEAAQKVSPAVVTITVQTGEPTDPDAVPETGVGSGLIYDSNGFILTNRHVVSDATQVTVELNDGRSVPGSVYGVDTLTDLAIVKIDASDLPAAPIGDSATLEPGETAIVIGSPLGTFTNSVTSGVVSALGRSLVVTDPVSSQQRRLRNLIQTDAAINPGNSGGPLINSAGDVVGVSTAYAQGAQGIFFAIPINIAKPIMSQAVAGEQLSRPWLGIVYQAVDRNVADENKLPVDYGAWISPSTASGDPAIVPGSPAEKAGLQAGDIITSIDGHRIDAGAGLDDVLSLFKPEDTLTLQVLRNGETISVPITLGTRPADLD